MTEWADAAKSLCEAFTDIETRRDLFTRWHKCANWARAAGKAAIDAEMFAFGRLLTFIINLGWEIQSQ